MIVSYLKKNQRVSFIYFLFFILAFQYQHCIAENTALNRAQWQNWCVSESNTIQHQYYIGKGAQMTELPSGLTRDPLTAP